MLSLSSTSSSASVSRSSSAVPNLKKGTTSGGLKSRVPSKIVRPISTSKPGLASLRYFQIQKFIIFSYGGGQYSSRSSVSVGPKGSTTKRGLGGQGDAFPAVVVRDSTGKDVTPVPLLALKASNLQQHSLNVEMEPSSPTVTYFVA
jgi:hypothetical protein